MNRIFRVSLSLLVLFGSLLGNQDAALATNYTSVASGVWNSDTGAGGVWSPDGVAPFYPVSGDQVTFNNDTITVNSPQSFGGVGTASTISNTTALGNFMPLNSTLTHDAGGSLTFNGSGYIIMTGSNGTFINNGTVTQATSGSNNWYWRGTNANVQNNGLLQFTGGSTWQMDSGSTILTNSASGTIDVLTNGTTIQGNDTDRYVVNAGLLRTTGQTLNLNARVDNTGTIRATNSGGLMLLNGLTNNSSLIEATGGAEVRMQGQLISTGGTFNANNASTIRFNGAPAVGYVTSAATNFTTSGTGQILLGGKINSLQGAWSGNVYLQESFSTGQATSFIDLTGGTLIWKGTNGSHNLNAGQALEFRSAIQYNGTGGYSVMNGGGTLRNVTGNTFSLGNGGTIYVRNSGGFENYGTVVDNGGTGWQIDSIPTTINNLGTFDVSTNAVTIGGGNDTDRYVVNSGMFRTSGTTLNVGARVDNTGTLRSQGSGGILAISGQTNNSSQIQADNSGQVYLNGRLNDTGGTLTATNSGIIHFGIGTNGHTTSTGTTFTTDGTGEIRLGGKISSIRGSWSGNVYLQESFATGQAVSYIDLTGGTLVWKGTNGSHSLNTGEALEFRSAIQYNGTGGYSVMNGGGTLRNVTGNTFSLGNGSSIYVRNSGGFENYGTVLDNGGTSWQIDSIPTTIKNYGTFDVTTTATSIGGGNDTDRYVVNSGLIRTTGTTFSVNARVDNTGTLLSQGVGGNLVISGQTNNSSQIQADGSGQVYLNGRLNNTVGSLTATNGGIIHFGIGANGHTTSASTTFTSDGTGQILLGGKINSLEGAWSGNVYLQESLTPGQALSYIDLTGGTLTWKGANISDNLTPGNVLEFRSPILFDGTTGYRVVNGAGTLRNATDNTFEQNSSNFYIRSGATFENAGEYHFVNSGGHNLNLDSGTATFRNLATGTMSVDAGSAFMNTTSAIGTFDNQGTLELKSGTTFSMNAAGTLPQYNGTNTLTGGTWKLLANSGQTTTLNLDPANAGITKIGAGAKVVIYEQDPSATATFSELGLIDDIAGEMYVHGTQVQTLSSTGVAVTGTLGGNGTYIAPNGITFNGGELDPSNLAGAGGTLSILGNVTLSPTTVSSFTLAQPGIGGLNDLVTINGDLVLDGILDINAIGALGNGRYRLFNFSGSITDNGLSFLNYNPRYAIYVDQVGHYVELVVTPEPSSVTLLMLGLVGLVARRRRRTV